MAAGVRRCERRCGRLGADGAFRRRARRGIAPSTWGARGRRGWHAGARRSMAASAAQKVQSPRGEGASPDARLHSGPQVLLEQRSGLSEGPDRAARRRIAQRWPTGLGAVPATRPAHRQREGQGSLQGHPRAARAAQAPGMWTTPGRRTERQASGKVVHALLGPAGESSSGGLWRTRCVALAVDRRAENRSPRQRSRLRSGQSGTGVIAPEPNAGGNGAAAKSP